jgi:dienelactone hydrolase
MKRMMVLGWLLVTILLCSCQPTISVDPPEVEFQDVSLSLSSVEPEDHLDLFTYDLEAPLEVQELDRWQQRGITFIDLTYASPTGNRVPATLLLPKGAGPFAGLVVQHGMPSTREAMYWLGQSYAQVGAVVVMIDAPWARPERQECEGYSCKTVPRFTEEDRTDQIELMLDLQRAVDLLLSRPEVDPQRLAYVGVSYGGAMGGLFAGIENRLKAYVLVVGDGGLVEHTAEPDSEGYPDHWSDAWVSAMWPIEPLHYIGRAAPAALLFQNGTKDRMVPPRDALRYQQAGSQPKTVMWYDAGHGLPVESLQDQSDWLYHHVGLGNLTFLKPNFSAAAVTPDRLIVAWPLMVAVSLILLFLDIVLGTPWTFGSLLNWVLVVFFFGPVGFLVYVITYRQPSRSINVATPLPLSKSALGSTVWSVAANLVGGIIVIGIVLTFPDVFNRAIYLQIIFSLLMPFITGFLVYHLVRMLSSLGSRYRLNLRRTIFAEVVSTCLVLGGAYPVVIILIDSWLSWLFPFGWRLANPVLYVILFLGAIAGAILAFPAHYWLIRSGLIVWRLPVPAREFESFQIEETVRLRWYQTLGVVMSALVIMLVGITIATLITL